MEFKIGDRVRTEFGNGTVKTVEKDMFYLVQHDNVCDNLHSGENDEVPDGTGWYCTVDEMTPLIETILEGDKKELENIPPFGYGNHRLVEYAKAALASGMCPRDPMNPKFVAEWCFQIAEAMIEQEKKYEV